jgi:hypothetical protein
MSCTFHSSVPPTPLASAQASWEALSSQSWAPCRTVPLFFSRASARTLKNRCATGLKKRWYRVIRARCQLGSFLPFTHTLSLYDNIFLAPTYKVSVGVGALAGSTIMLLTLPWFLSILGGRVDIDHNGQPVYKKVRAAPTWNRPRLPVFPHSFSRRISPHLKTTAAWRHPLEQALHQGLQRALQNGRRAQAGDWLWWQAHARHGLGACGRCCGGIRTPRLSPFRPGHGFSPSRLIFSLRTDLPAHPGTGVPDGR